MPLCRRLRSEFFSAAAAWIVWYTAVSRCFDVALAADGKADDDADDDDDNSIVYGYWDDDAWSEFPNCKGECMSDFGREEGLSAFD